jgi:type I restriction enzyme S subunit
VKTVQFGTLFLFIRNGMNVKQDKSGDGLPITRIQTISHATVDGTRVGFAGLEEANCRDWLLETGDILFSHINSVEHIGKCAVYRDAPEKLVHGMNLLCLRSDMSKLLPEFAKYLIRGAEFRTRLSNYINKAVNQASVSICNLKTIPVTLPPLAEQRRIAEVLDQAEALRAKRRAALAQLDALTQSLFLDLFGDPFENPRGWSIFPFSEVCETTQGVQIPRDKQTEEPSEGYERYLYINDFYSDDSPKYIEARFPQKRVTNDDLVMANTGSPGRVFKGRSGILSNNLFKITFDTKKITTVFFYHFLASDLFQRHLQGQMKQGIQSHLGHKTFGVQRLPLPPITLQREFARRVTVVEALKTVQRASLAELDALFAALQYRALRGELRHDLL